MLSHKKLPSAKIINQRVHANPRGVWVELIEEYGEEFFFQGNLVTANPARVYELLHNRKHTLKRSKVYKIMGRFLLGTDGILFQDGEQWQAKLRETMPVLTKVNVEQYRSDLYEIASRHAKEWSAKKKTNDLYLDVANLGLEMVLKVCYGLNIADQLTKSYGHALRDFKLFMMYDTVRLDEFGASLGQVKKLPAILRDTWKMRKKIKQQTALLGQLIEEKKVEKYQLNWINLFQKMGMPLSEISTELNHIYAAFNAIDYQITCAIYALNAFSECRIPLMKELKEIDSATFSKSKNPSVDFPEITAFMKEVFRFFPATISVMRQTGEVFEAANQECPIGTEVVILMHALHFNPKYWDEPEQFNPNRFKKPLKEPKAFIPFLAGPRKCIGQHLAESHFLHTLFAIIQAGIPKINPAGFELQPYMIPRLKHRLKADFS